MHTAVVHIGHVAPRAPKAPHVAHFLREHRERAGLTQEQAAAKLADILGKTSIGGEQISRWERGEKSPRPDTMTAFAKLYGTSVNGLHASPRRKLPAGQQSLDELLINAGADEQLWTTARNVLEGLLRSR